MTRYNEYLTNDKEYSCLDLWTIGLLEIFLQNATDLILIVHVVGQTIIRDHLDFVILVFNSFEDSLEVVQIHSSIISLRQYYPSTDDSQLLEIHSYKPIFKLKTVTIEVNN